MSDSGLQDYYKILGVKREAGPDEIRVAYLSKLGASRSNSRFYYSRDQIERAYETLTNPQQRCKYDSVIDSGYFWNDTVVVDATGEARVMNIDSADELASNAFRKNRSARNNARTLPKPLRLNANQITQGCYLREAKREQSLKRFLMAVALGAPVAASAFCAWWLGVI